MRLFFISIFALVMFVLPVKAEVNIDWETASVEDVQQAIKAENNVDDKFLTQLLMQACAKSRNMDIIDELIRLGAKIDKKVIHNVSYHNKFRDDLIALFKQGKENIDKEALKEISVKNHTLMQKLFENRIDKDVEPNFALEEWWQMAWLEDIQKEIDSGADINIAYWGFTPLHMAIASHKGYDIVKFMIEKGADVNKRGIEDPLKMAVENSSLEIIELLLKSGANVHISEDYEQGLLFDLCSKPFENEEKIDLLLKYGADINEKTRAGWTVLESFLAEGNVELASWWIKKGADVPKDILARKEVYHGDSITPEIIDFLVEQGADVNAKYDDNEIIYTPLRAVVEKAHHPELINRLIELGAEVNAIVQYDYTVLELAIQNSYMYDDFNMIEALLKNGAKVKSLDNLEEYTFGMPVKEELKKLLIKYGAK